MVVLESDLQKVCSALRECLRNSTDHSAERLRLWHGQSDEDVRRSAICALAYLDPMTRSAVCVIPEGVYFVGVEGRFPAVKEGSHDAG